jgi:hypothetical protein
MNYPVWELGAAGGGFLIALIAVVHVYVSHFAVGGGLFLVLTEMKAYREESDDLLDYVKTHSRFFLLLTMIFGSVTGVGIWFTIALLSPGATSTLIHIFVFGFAAEWACFLGEIIALLIYYYRFDKMDRRSHLIVGWLYFLFAWLSLFFINGIIDFMLTPGSWIETGNFWDGFFNPTTWPALFFRTAMAFACAGLFGFLTAVYIRGEQLRLNMVRYCAKWLLPSFMAMPFFSWWYLESLPAASKSMVLGQSPELAVIANVFIWLVPVIVVGGLIMASRTPGAVKKPLAFLLLFTGLMYMGAFEWTREAARRPYLIYGHTWSTSVKISDLPSIEKEGFLKAAKWVRHREITPENISAAGEELFRLQCLACHSRRGPMNDIVPLTRDLTEFAIEARLAGHGKISRYMPEFLGTEDERRALARYIVERINKGGPEKPPAVTEPSVKAAQLPAFDIQQDEYVLLAWSRRGMAVISDCDRFWTLDSPANEMTAQLVKRGETPEIVTTDIAMRYLPVSGRTGKTKRGNPVKMQYDEEQMAYRTINMAVSPYQAEGGFNPYPQFTVEAVETESGRVLAGATVTVPVSTELGCNNCHRGSWKVNGTTGISGRTAKDILETHDRISRTDLAARADSGKPVNCRACHADATEGNSNTGLLNLSASIHGFHAVFLKQREEKACYTCHPSSSGATRGYRGLHRDIELECINCHGTMEKHALGLLADARSNGSQSAARLVKILSSEYEDSRQIPGRKPWVNEPDCLHCHVDFQEPETDEVPREQKTGSAEELFKNRMDDAGLMCQACHGAAHALYPARNHIAQGLDNTIPLQYQATPYPVGADKQCRVCHTIDMEDEMHHPNMLTMFRNRW